MAASSDQITAFNAQFIDQPEYRIQSGDYEWRVHGAVISKQSRFFEKVCNSDFKEANEKLIVLHDDHPWAIAIVIQWLYRVENQTLDDILTNAGQYKHLMAALKQCSVESDTNGTESQNTTTDGTIQETTAESSPEIVDQTADGNTDETKQSSDAQRGAGEVMVHIYQIANKYEIDGLMSDARMLLFDKMCKDSSLIKFVAAVLGEVIIKTDKRLCDDMLEALWFQEERVKSMDRLWEKLFDSEPALMRAMRQFFADKLDEGIESKWDWSDRLRKILKVLVEAETQMNSHTSNRAPKEKIQEAKKLLKRLQDCVNNES